MDKNICAFCNSNLENSSHFTKCHSKTNFFTSISVCHHCVNTESKVEDFFFYPSPYSVFAIKLRNQIDSNLISPDFLITYCAEDRINSRFFIDMEKQKRILVKFLENEKELIRDFLEKIKLNLNDYKFEIKENPYQHFNENFRVFEFIFDGKLVFIDGKKQTINNISNSL